MWRLVSIAFGGMLFAGFTPQQLPAQAETAEKQQLAEIKDAAELLPATTAIVARISDPDGLVRLFLDHPLHERLKANPETAKVYNAPQVLQAKAGLKMVEFMLGMSYYDTVKSLGGDGLTVAFDTETNGAVALLKAPDSKQQKKTLQIVMGAIKQQQKNGGRKIETAEYRGFKAYKLNNVTIGDLDGWILVSNKPELARAVADARIDQPDENLAGQDWYRKTLGKSNGSEVLTAAIHLETVRKAADGFSRALEGTRENPVAELLLGGVFENLKHAEFAQAGLSIDEDLIRLRFETPHQSDWIPEQREYYFGPNGAGRAKVGLRPNQTIFNMSVYRDIAKMWLYGGDLFNQRVNDGMAEAESTLSTLFAGRDFVEEILGLIKPEVQLVVNRQSFEGRLPIPALKLPSFALVGELKDPAAMRPELRRTFQSAVGFFNVVGAMEGNPQMDQDKIKEGDGEILTASFVPTPEDKTSTSATVHFNFSPSLAMSGKHFALASSLPLAKQLMKNFGQEHADEPDNTKMTLHAESLKAILFENREFLISNNMLEDGNSRKEAEREIGLLFTILELFGDLNGKLAASDKDLRFDLQLSFAK